MDNKKIGSLGEEEALKYLNKMGYKIIERNFNSIYGEIDIIAFKDNVLVFVEVKLRRTDKFGQGYEAVNIRKQQKIIKTAQFFLQKQGRNNLSCRFDVISISLNNSYYSINHYKDAFQVR